MEAIHVSSTEGLKNALEKTSKEGKIPVFLINGVPFVAATEEDAEGVLADGDGNILCFVKMLELLVAGNA